MHHFSIFLLLLSVLRFGKQSTVGTSRNNFYHWNQSSIESNNHHEITVRNLNDQKSKKNIQVDFNSTYLPESCLIKTQINDQLSVLYVGTFPNGGKQFDAIQDPNNPFIFTLGTGEVIKGWDQGLLGMCEGEKRMLHIPSELAYGHNGAGDDIPPDSSLEFRVELIAILKRKYQSIPSLQHLEIKVLDKPLSCPIKSKNQHKLKMIYVGTLRSTGLQFDSMKDPKHPFEFQLGVGQVIKGWDQGLKDMCIQEKRKLLIPARLAYGHNGFGSSQPPIPPDADLVFDVQLIDIQNDEGNRSKSNYDQRQKKDRYGNENTFWIWIWFIFESLTFFLQWILIFF